MEGPPFRKVTLWQYPLGDLEGDVLYLDLDIVICGDLDRFFDYEKGEYCVAENWTQIGKNIGNTSCYRFPVGRYKHIFDDFNADPAKIEKKYGISQKYISDAVGKMVYWPVNHFADSITDVFLGDAIFFFNFCGVSIEIIKDMLVATHRKTIARRVANIFANLCPVFGNAIFAFFIIKKAV